MYDFTKTHQVEKLPKLHKIIKIWSPWFRATKNNFWKFLEIGFLPEKVFNTSILNY
jgi:hypothetical protein